MQGARISLLVLPIIGTIACGSSTTPPKPDAGPSPSDPAYWGLADQTCWRYDDGSKNNYYTIAVNADHTTIAGTTTYHLAFRLQGLQQRDDWLAVSGNDLVTWRHTDPPSGTPPKPIYWLYSPAPIFFQAGLAVGQSANSTTMAMKSDGTDTNTVSLSFSVIDEVQEDVNALGTAQLATKYLVNVSDGATLSTVDRFWFVPQVGIGQFQLSGQTSPWTLTKIDANVASNDCVPPIN